MAYNEKELRNKAEAYRKAENDPLFKKEIEDALSEKNWENLFDRFYTTLAFGTAGMRGVLGGGTNRINNLIVRKVTQGLSEYLNETSTNPSVVIAYDSRHYSKEFAMEASLVLAGNGVSVYLYDTLHPVPMLSFAVRYLKTTAGIVITASHNPAKYNGYKVYWSDGGQVTPPHDFNIAGKANAVKYEDIHCLTEKQARDKGLLVPVPESVDEAYYHMVLASLRRPALVQNSPITVAYTPLHGTGNVPLRHLLERVGIRCVVVKEQEQPDGSFPTVTLPNPENPQAMERVIELAKKVKADIVLGTDPDADRLGIAIPVSADKKEYKLLTGNQIAALLCDYLIRSNEELQTEKRTPLCVKSLVTTDLVKDITLKHGGKCKEVLTGFKYIAEQIAALEGPRGEDEYFLFGCEESYGYLTVPSVRDKDAVSSALVAVEMMCYYAKQGILLQQRLEAIYDEYGYRSEVVFSRDYEGSAGKERMVSIMTSLRSLKEGDVLAGRTIDSIEDLLSKTYTGFPPSDVVIIHFVGGEKLVVRPSGTEPKIKYYLFLTAPKGKADLLQQQLPSIVETFKAAL
ncbi:phosphomannomutase [Sphaerochaeta pleomorpha str. Grapes]|uniref:Phosphomannomutase n=1 Tax=Sphaerochaeta pleomorpha (strain ATCC BAA-1885 / DSM 22778 / Grapes) TaxID=158190 RepID=G8QXR7_SPHPG|nr:phospho-sugar mutase [Sphaerochaeta pleomorpha]AEV30711.1 phosphomannomutase [Sphaerochaeta pleomorpha str. Grapes]